MPNYDDVMTALRNADAAAERGEPGAAEDAKRLAQMASGLKDPNNGFLGQMNRGIANTVGGLADFVNPFDDPAWKDIAGGRFHTGSAKDALATGMDAINARVADREPETVFEGMGRGTGDALGALVPVAKGLQSLKSMGGAVGAFADDAVRVLSTKLGLGAEATAGAISGGARETAKQGGAGPVGQDVAALLSPLSVPATAAATVGSVKLAGKTPVMGTLARTGIGAVKRALVPMSESGAREMVKDRLHGLVGGEDRAAELGRSIKPNDELGISAARQTEDPNLVALEQAAKDESPLLRERMLDNETASRETARGAIEGMGGDVADARMFFDNRLNAFRQSMSERLDRVVAEAEKGLGRLQPGRTETTTSEDLVARIKGELANSLEREKMLWAAVPREALAGTTQSKATAQVLLGELPRAQIADFPAPVRRLLIDEGGFGDQETVAELHGLYSELRRITRSAMAGTDQNKNQARIANQVADAILADLGALDASSPAGRAINEARAFSQTLHETFDQGAVGRILKRTLDGDETIPTEAALQRTVGRGGASAVADARGIERAASGSKAEITDYLRGRFLDSVFNASGEFTPKAARTWLRKNNELLLRYPELRKEIGAALSGRDAASSFGIRLEARAKLAETGPVGRFTHGPEEKSVLSILGSDDPARTAATLVRTARKDPSGRALAGLRAAVSDHLIDGALSRDGALSGRGMLAALTDKRLRAAMQQVYTPQELGRIQRIARSLSRLDLNGKEVGPIMDSPANRLVDMTVRIAAARYGGNVGGDSMGGSLQTANIFVERARSMLKGLTNDRARRLLMDAIEDPELFKALMTEPKGIKLPKEVQSRLAPYLLGGASGQGDQE